MNVTKQNWLRNWKSGVLYVVDPRWEGNRVLALCCDYHSVNFCSYNVRMSDISDWMKVHCFHSRVKPLENIRFQLIVLREVTVKCKDSNYYKVINVTYVMSCVVLAFQLQ